MEGIIVEYISAKNFSYSFYDLANNEKIGELYLTKEENFISDETGFEIDITAVDIDNVMDYLKKTTPVGLKVIRTAEVADISTGEKFVRTELYIVPEWKISSNVNCQDDVIFCGDIHLCRARMIKSDMKPMQKGSPK